MELWSCATARYVCISCVLFLSASYIVHCGVRARNRSVSLSGQSIQNLSHTYTGTERHTFSHLLKSLTNSLPDDDSQYSVYDYYVDESGEWDVWQTRLPPPTTLTATVGLLGNVYVDTTDSVS